MDFHSLEALVEFERTVYKFPEDIDFIDVCAVVNISVEFPFTVVIQHPNNGNANLSYMYSLCCFVSIKDSLHELMFSPNDRRKCTMITDPIMGVFIIMLNSSMSFGLDPRITLSSEGAVIIGKFENL